MKVGYKKRKGKKERVRRRREDAAEDMAMSADGDTTPVMSREGVAVPIVAPPGSPAAALSDDDCKEGELDMMVGPSHISQPSMDRSGAESPTSPGKHMTARERHRLGVSVRKAIRSKVTKIKAHRASLGKGAGVRDRKRELADSVKALLIEQAAVKGLKLGGAPGNKCGSLRYLSHAVDPRALETAINQTVAEATISGLAL